MTMNTKTRHVPAGEFKAKCLALLDEVSITGEELIVTKRGKPVAKVAAVETAEPPTLIGSVRWEKDIVSPVDEDWKADK